ncbi:MAG: 2-succinyl-5-enolpyruvyl-6-hydroxy-3-cyclohexene-1-carboxylic-acid synthase [Candidatus Zixiibacteriota bacterium]|nr:MAG: 2-succinyl-5-enolpyruvyl-6-hydroxy-3-cyclohexene-1-carboxylic-acid synthase [candidate division Zixibacteria bacterium]
MTPDLSNYNTFATSLMIEELVRLGVTFFAISPGFRNAPLTVAAARHPKTQKVVHFDERGAAFLALGHARATGRPAAVICTSGTAVANYFPAVVEASQDGIPLILLTADRPEELRNCGANQTIDQIHFFGKYVRYDVDLPCPDDRHEPDCWLTTIDTAFAAAMGHPPGPVHLNCQFREPLVPLPNETQSDISTRAIASWLDSDRPYSAPAKAKPAADRKEVEGCARIINSADSGMLIIGTLRSESERKAVCKLTESLAWPVLPDIKSSLPLSSADVNFIHYYDLLLESGTFPPGNKETVLLQIGSRLVSKRLVQFIEDLSPKHYIHVDIDPRCLDPTHRVTNRITGDIAGTCAALVTRISRSDRSNALEDILNKDRRAAEIIDRCVLAENRLSEPSVLRLLSGNLPGGCALFLANSMPIRLMDVYAASGTDATVVANRGASGIDGTVASAVGYAIGYGGPTVLLIGDLALLHDLSSLSLVQKHSPSLTVIVLNNNGGGIFDRLPIAQCEDVHEEFFVAPHGHTFEKACEMFGLTYHAPDTPDKFVSLLSETIDSPALIELAVDRADSLRVHREIVRQLVP